MAYMTIKELKASSVFPEICDAAEAEDIQLQLLLDYCTALIDAYVGYSFTRELNITIYVDGEGSNKIALHKRIYNIISISSTNGYVYNTSNLRITGKGNRRIINSLEDFEDGVDNIEVCGDFGWPEVPEEILLCLTMLCNGNVSYLSDEDKMSQAMGPFKSEKIGNYSYELKTKVNSVTGAQIDTTGDDRVDLILEKYRSDGFSIGVV